MPVLQRFMILFIVPAALMLVSVLGCSVLQDPRLGERAVETATAVSSIATAYAEEVRATATAVAPSVQMTATAVAQNATSAMPAPLQPLAEQFGLIFVRVPAGEFTMGQPGSEKAKEPVSLEEYWIGLTEVTNENYRLFIEAGGYDDASLWEEAGWEWRTSSNVIQPACWDDPIYNTPEQPVACISWYEGMAYAAWLQRETGLDVRLPSEAEWEKAARGSDARLYPWGDAAPNSALANYAGGLGAPAPVGTRPDGASPYGALDMLGNVAEWTSTPADFDAEQRVVRGGSWFSLADSLGASLREFYAPTQSLNLLGLRLVVTLE